MSISFDRLFQWAVYHARQIDSGWYLLAAGIAVLLTGTALWIASPEDTNWIQKIRSIALGFLAAYLLLVLASTVFCREAAVHDPRWDLDVMNFIRKWQRGVSLRAEVGLNLLLLLPVGIALPIVLGRFRNVFLVTFLGFLLSFLIEWLQLYYQKGLFEASDILFNTAGVFLGYLIFRIVYALGEGHRQRKKRMRSRKIRRKYSRRVRR